MAKNDYDIVYEYTPPLIRLHTKTVKYACGCTVKLGGWDESFAPMYCGKHNERILKIMERREKVLCP